MNQKRRKKRTTYKKKRKLTSTLQRLSSQVLDSSDNCKKPNRRLRCAGSYFSRHYMRLGQTYHTVSDPAAGKQPHWRLPCAGTGK